MLLLQMLQSVSSLYQLLCKGLRCTVQKDFEDLLSFQVTKPTKFQDADRAISAGRTGLCVECTKSQPYKVKHFLKFCKALPNGIELLSYTLNAKQETSHMSTSLLFKYSHVYVFSVVVSFGIRLINNFSFNVLCVQDVK